MRIHSILHSFPADEEQRRHRGPKDLSDHEHYSGHDHNAEYDHEAFLGKEEAKRFSELSPKESRRRLGCVTSLYWRAVPWSRGPDVRAPRERLAREIETRCTPHWKKSTFLREGIITDPCNIPSLFPRVIVDKIDKDKDGQVTQDELQAWVRHASMRFVHKSLVSSTLTDS